MTSNERDTTDGGTTDATDVLPAGDTTVDATRATWPVDIETFRRAVVEAYGPAWLATGQRPRPDPPLRSRRDDAGDAHADATASEAGQPSADRQDDDPDHDGQDSGGDRP